MSEAIQKPQEIDVTDAYNADLGRFNMQSQVAGKRIYVTVDPSRPDVLVVREVTQASKEENIYAVLQRDAKFVVFQEVIARATEVAGKVDDVLEKQS